ncbi:FIST N-terminal domain-containing protein [Sulfitobacter sp. S190]|uniref:FIST N-terminal domain-containing protein n=1 Tax=Sulfitobacter sp. S190 TaxID=2867022 RepID=UPI0021A96138|nr:FIST N-terminal domain-containing protein [Sulfitobacter sp. S190]
MAWDADDAIADLHTQIATEPLALVALFIPARADFAALVARASEVFGAIDVVACTTAGEIGAGGYEDGVIIATGFPAAHFASTSILIEELDDGNTQSVLDRIAVDTAVLRDANSTKRQAFGFLVIDGLSLREDTLTAAIAPALRNIPLFGGSAGDGTEFARTLVALNGRVCENAAVLSVVLTDHQTRVFSIDHLVPTDTQMVVTEADPDRRVVKEINAEPAAREYARLVGKDPEQLDQFTFASHPVVVRIGSTHHVRAIQRINEVGELVFFSAIDEGMVLTLAEPQHMANHLETSLAELAQDGAPSDIMGCDCLLRRLEAEQTQQTRQLSKVLRKHKVVGFSTYGEQIGPLHVNHTMTGVAIYPACTTDRDVAD